MTDSHCPIHARLTPASCAAQHRRYRNTSDTIACRTCPIGAENAGMPLPSVEALWPWDDIRPGDVIAGVEVLVRHPFTFEACRYVWVRWPDGSQTDESIWTLRRWKKLGRAA